MRSKILLLSSVALLFFGCSEKQYYTPKNLSSSSSATTSSSPVIVGFSRDGATLVDGSALTKREQLKLNLKNGYRFINKVANTTIISDRDGRCRLLKDGKAKDVKFKKELISATVIGNALVYLLQDNNFGIYNLSTDKIIYNNKAEKVSSIDTRVANPLQVDNLVVIPLLNGKLTILDLRTLKIAKEIFVSTNSSLNNIIFLKRFKDTLIAATPHKIISVNKQGKRELEREISEVDIDNDSIFLFSKDGRVSRLDSSLKIRDEKKLRFAHFCIAGLYKDRVYAMDKQGYLVVNSKDFTKESVYEFSEIEGYSFISGGKLYYNNGDVLDLESLSY